MSNEQGEFPFPAATPELVPLRADELARLQCAGAGANEIEAVMRAPINLRDKICGAFAAAFRDNFALLKSVVAVIESRIERGFPPAGADVLVNAARNRDGVDCENGIRCFVVRIVCLVRDDLRKMIVMKPGAQANVLLCLGWKPPEL